MNMIFTYLTYFSAILALSMMIYLFNAKRKKFRLYSAIYLQVIAFLWSFGKILEWQAKNIMSKWVAYNFSFLAIDFSAVGILIHCLAIATNDRFKKKYLWLYILPTIFHIGFLTNKYHNWYFSQYGSDVRMGPLFYMNALTISIYTISGVYYLIVFMGKQNNLIKKQVKYVLYSLIVPFGVGLIGVVNSFTDYLPRYDLAPPCFCLSIFLVTLASYRFRFFNIFPIAAKTIINNLQDNILVLDYENNIISKNISFCDRFSDCQDINQFIELVAGKEKLTVESERLINVINDTAITRYSSELKLNIEGERIYYVNILPLFNKSICIGRIVTLNDITAYKKSIQDLTDLHSRHDFSKEICDIIDDITLLLVDACHAPVNNSAETDYSCLTNQEIQIIEYVAQGKNNKTIASEMGLSEGRIRNKITEIFKKTGLGNRTELANFYFSWKIKKIKKIKNQLLKSN
jgi:DNA-binding CsgD family transcriptional regulator